MVLNPEKTREIRQLMLVALHYLRAASAAETKAHSSITFGSMSTDFPLSGDLEESLRERTIISADLASAAIRLASVDHVLERAGYGRSVYSQCQTYFGEASRVPRMDLREHPEWFHIILRDVVGHVESEKGRDQEQGERYGHRRDFIAATTLREAYAQLRKTANELGAKIKRFGIVVPE